MGYRRSRTRSPFKGRGSVIARSSASGTPDFRILEVAAGGILAAQHLTLTNGRDTSGAGGGGILNNGSVTMTRSHVVGNTAITTDDGLALGGGILNLGNLTVSTSTVRDNTAKATGAGRALGGGIRNGSIGGESASLVIISSVVQGNVASAVSIEEAGGGGIASATGPVTVRSSQVNANTASGSGAEAVVQGGGIAARGN